MYLEEEAKKLWCPMSQHHHDERCIASACLMWRWEMTGDERGLPYNTGYCGLAGKPQGDPMEYDAIIKHRTPEEAVEILADYCRNKDAVIETLQATLRELGRGE